MISRISVVDMLLPDFEALRGFHHRSYLVTIYEGRKLVLSYQSSLCRWPIKFQKSKNVRSLSSVNCVSSNCVFTYLGHSKLYQFYCWLLSWPHLVKVSFWLATIFRQIFGSAVTFTLAMVSYLSLETELTLPLLIKTTWKEKVTATSKDFPLCNRTMWSESFHKTFKHSSRTWKWLE